MAAPALPIAELLLRVLHCPLGVVEAALAALPKLLHAFLQFGETIAQLLLTLLQFFFGRRALGVLLLALTLRILVLIALFAGLRLLTWIALALAAARLIAPLLAFARGLPLALAFAEGLVAQFLLLARQLVELV